MRGAERTQGKQQLYGSVVGSDRYPVQIVWARDDPALPLCGYGHQAARAAGIEPVTIPGKHFPREDNVSKVADRIASFIMRTGAS
jgi:haloalkane dehalogenase